MATLKLVLEYDGRGFSGWAAQPGLRTVENELRTALDAVFPSWDGLAVAGRTDAGVHALGQVASLDAEGGPPLERAGEALNAELPGDVAVISVEEAPRELPRALLRPLALVPLPDLAAPDAVALRARAELVPPAPARRGAPPDEC